MKINTAEKRKGRERKKAVKNESEKKERMLERAVVRSSWFWFNINLKAALAWGHTCPFALCLRLRDTSGH